VSVTQFYIPRNLIFVISFKCTTFPDRQSKLGQFIFLHHCAISFASCGHGNSLNPIQKGSTIRMRRKFIAKNHKISKRNAEKHQCPDLDSNPWLQHLGTAQIPDWQWT